MTGHDVFNIFFRYFRDLRWTEIVLALQRIIQLLIVPQHRRTFLIKLLHYTNFYFFKAVFYNSEGVKVLFQELCDPLDI